MSSKEPKPALNYDEVLEYIGQFGTFQRKIFFLLWLVSAAGGLAVVVFAFTGMLLVLVASTLTCTPCQV